MAKYVVISDIHAHTWSLFSQAMPNGVNSRLQHILNEMERAAEYGFNSGAELMVMAGDLFHLRGVIDPEVLNPVRKSVEKILKRMPIVAIPGNHDLKSRDTSELSSAIENLNGLSVTHEGKTNYFTVANKPQLFILGDIRLGLIPWRHDKDGVVKGFKELQSIAANYEDSCDFDVFIHYGIDGVIPNISGNELTANEIADFGFRRVFAGHYHNHKVFPRGVCSIGAIAHHNWGDIGTRAGFLVLDTDDKSILHIPSTAPHFVDISGYDENEIILACPNSYVRFRGGEMTPKEVNDLRTELLGYGALGVSIEVPRVKANPRTTTSTTKTVTIEGTINDFVDAMPVVSGVTADTVKKMALEVLEESKLLP